MAHHARQPRNEEQKNVKEMCVLVCRRPPCFIQFVFIYSLLKEEEKREMVGYNYKLVNGREK